MQITSQIVNEHRWLASKSTLRTLPIPRGILIVLLLTRRLVHTGPFTRIPLQIALVLLRVLIISIVSFAQGVIGAEMQPFGRDLCRQLIAGAGDHLARSAHVAIALLVGIMLVLRFMSQIS